jgi:hypothetical protein
MSCDLMVKALDSVGPMVPQPPNNIAVAIGAIAA